MVVGSLRMVPPGIVPSGPSPMCKEVASEAREIRSFIGWDSPHPVLAGIFYQLKCTIILDTWT